MICKCPKCDGALKYNPTVSKMECPYCANVFDVQTAKKEPESAEACETAQKETEAWEEQPVAESGQQEEEKETISCRIYSCTSCGAEVAVNDTEVSTYCGYCGQPTIIFKRVSKEQKPKYILPFKINKEQAVEKIRKTVREGMFVPKEIKNFEVERVRGIYVPYRIYNIDYYDRQKLMGDVRSGKSYVKRYYLREAECAFKGISCDASRRLDDKMMDWLEPYDMKDLVPFDAKYLSGFYADKDDVQEQQLLKRALKRVKILFDDEMKKSTQATDVKVCMSKSKYHVSHTDYIMLPVWFLNFSYKDEFYTMLVNGQSGKVVGAVPADHKKKSLFFLITSMIFSLISFPVCWFGYRIFCEDSEVAALIAVIVFAAIVCIICIGVGCSIASDVKKQIKKTKNRAAEAFVRKRQEENV